MFFEAPAEVVAPLPKVVPPHARGYTAPVSRLVLRYTGRGIHCVVDMRLGALAVLGSSVRRATGATRVVVVADPRADALYGDAARRSLRRAGIDAERILVPRGERSKRPAQLVRLWNAFAGLELERGDAIVALGGGVVGDLAGFAAATWMRGVPWVGVPTTVVAQVDSGIGGKTAIDLAAGKNLAGAFHHPAAVLVDPELLRSLRPREFRAGLAEVAKVGFATDASLFRALERNAPRIAAREPGVLLDTIRGAIRAKARVVTRDEREREGGVRAALNFGHTLGHALETAVGYRGLRHGEAIAIGMRVAARLSERVAGLEARDRARLDALLDAWELPGRIAALEASALERAMRHDKKRRGRIRWVLTPRLGHASLPRLVSARIVRAALLEAGATA